MRPVSSPMTARNRAASPERSTSPAVSTVPTVTPRSPGPQLGDASRAAAGPRSRAGSRKRMSPTRCSPFRFSPSTSRGGTRMPLPPMGSASGPRRGAPEMGRATSSSGFSAAARVDRRVLRSVFPGCSSSAPVPRPCGGEPACPRVDRLPRMCRSRSTREPRTSPRGLWPMPRRPGRRPARRFRLFWPDGSVASGGRSPADPAGCVVGAVASGSLPGPVSRPASVCARLAPAVAGGPADGPRRRSRPGRPPRARGARVHGAPAAATPALPVQRTRHPLEQVRVRAGPPPAPPPAPSGPALQALHRGETREVALREASARERRSGWR